MSTHWTERTAQHLYSRLGSEGFTHYRRSAQSNSIKCVPPQAIGGGARGTEFCSALQGRGQRLHGLLQPGTRGASLEGLVLHGLQSRLGGVNLLLDLLEGLRLLQHLVPLPPHNALIFASHGSELGQEVTPLPLRLLQPLTCRCHTLLPVGRVVSCPVEDHIALCWRRSVSGLQLLLRLLQGSLQRIELLLHCQQGISQFRNLPPPSHKERIGMHLPLATELLKIGLTLLARRSNASFEFGNFWCRWRGRRYWSLYGWQTLRW